MKDILSIIVDLPDTVDVDWSCGFEGPACPACGETHAYPVRASRVQVCGECYTLHGSVYRGDLFTILNPSGGLVPETGPTYGFDLEVLTGSDLSVRRIHGRADVASKRLVQIG